MLGLKPIDCVSVRHGDDEVDRLRCNVIYFKSKVSKVTVLTKSKAETWAKPAMGDIDTQIEEDNNIEEEITSSEAGQITIDHLLYSQKCIIASLLDELEAIAPHIGQIKTWIAEEMPGDKDSNRRQAMYRVRPSLFPLVPSAPAFVPE